jgi:hypothetical protein
MFAVLDRSGEVKMGEAMIALPCSSSSTPVTGTSAVFMGAPTTGS